MLIFLILYALDAATSILRPLTDAFCDLYVMILLQRTSSYNVSEDTKDNLSRLFYLLLLFFSVAHQSKLRLFPVVFLRTTCRLASMNKFVYSSLQHI